MGENALKAELAAKMRRAQRGDLWFGEDREVDQMRSRARVLEIRVGAYNVGGQVIHARAYFTEPEHEPRVLLFLRLAVKEPGPMGLDEQDEHVREADLRIDRHYGLI